MFGGITGVEVALVVVAVSLVCDGSADCCYAVAAAVGGVGVARAVSVTDLDSRVEAGAMSLMNL